eukprot:COSAG06_NODE_44711_length_361_cov_0.782443_1_plen_35_part_01
MMCSLNWLVLLRAFHTRGVCPNKQLSLRTHLLCFF